MMMMDVLKIALSESSGMFRDCVSRNTETLWHCTSIRNNAHAVYGLF